MSTTPWASIAESLVPVVPARTLKHNVAVESPCSNCSTSPCCTHLPLTTFKVTNLVELDHARYLLNFDNIELSISAAGDWSAYYTYPCRYLNRQTFECSVHDDPRQPQICVHYNPYNCWYKRVFTVGQNDEVIRLDRARMELLLEHIEFDEQRRITTVPGWDAMVEMMSALDDRPKPPGVPGPYTDAALERWEASIASEDGPAEDAAPNYRSAAELQDPCTGCAAYCCTTLVFPQAVPVHISSLDYFRFCLGFPGVELGIGDGQWSIVIKTRCRHLQDDNRCGVYGQPERPIICKYYDQWKCDYKRQFGETRPADMLRLRLEQWEWLAACFLYDESGAIAEIPPMETLRAAIETQWKQHGVLETIPLMVVDAASRPAK
ncbi:MAG: hypothetical protein WD557_08930 [Dehalococcoidia bacterium]